MNPAQETNPMNDRPDRPEDNDIPPFMHGMPIELD
jgi:hypothetical protein